MKKYEEGPTDYPFTVSHTISISSDLQMRKTERQSELVPTPKPSNRSLSIVSLKQLFGLDGLYKFTMFKHDIQMTTPSNVQVQKDQIVTACGIGTYAYHYKVLGQSTQA
jgi:hypothetical protein